MSKRILTLALSVLTFGALTTAVAEAGEGPVVRTDSGPVRGVSTGEYRSFQGIPFAAPPVGDLRWAPTARPEPWTAVRDASLNWPDGGFIPGVPAGSLYPPRAAVEAIGADAASELGCADVACLRGLPVKDLVNQPFANPAFDTALLPEHPAAALEAGHFARVPVLTGITRDEAWLFVALYPGQPFTEAHYQELLRTAFGEKAPLVAARYPSAEHGSPAMAFADAMTDRIWGCPQVGTERSLRERTRTFGYEFADRDAPPLLPGPVRDADGRGPWIRIGVFD